MRKKFQKNLKKVCRLIFLPYLCTRNTAAGCSAVRLAHLVWDQRVPGSNPGIPTERDEKSPLFFLAPQPPHHLTNFGLIGLIGQNSSGATINHQEVYDTARRSMQTAGYTDTASTMYFLMVVNSTNTGLYKGLMMQKRF